MATWGYRYKLFKKTKGTLVKKFSARVVDLWNGLDQCFFCNRTRWYGVPAPFPSYEKQELLLLTIS